MTELIEAGILFCFLGSLFGLLTMIDSGLEDDDEQA